MDNYQAYIQQYRSALLEDVIPFWEKFSIDQEKGGYFTCLNRNGQVYDTDKFIWLQARQVWTFSMLYALVEQKYNWKEIAYHGLGFLEKHGRDTNGNWYFSLDRAGNPLVQPYNIFSDCFAAMAFGRIALTFQDDHAARIALQTYNNILRREMNPKGIYNKIVANTRPVIGFALPMILANLTLELKPLLPLEVVEKQIDRCIHQVMDVFYDPNTSLILESMSPEGKLVDSFEGRLINPGHTVEAMWFMIEIGERRQDNRLIQKAVEIMLTALSFGWDSKYGGIFYFLDRLGYPPQQLEWDQKLWWVHLEALVALSMAYEHTHDPECWQWFQKIHNYTWQRFPDPEYGEWYGYLDRRGEVLLPLKGGKWKGCFHVPRALYRCWRVFDRLSALFE
jgi:N-acylglucosamine 2-epimerase